MVVSQNMMFYTTMWCIPNIVCEYAPRCINTNGIRAIHLRIHRIFGIFLIGIPVVAHVLLVFLPPIVDRTKLTYSPPSCFNYSKLGHLNWTKFWDPAAVEGWSTIDAHGVHLTSDELYRLILMIFLFFFLFPLSRSSFLNERSYTFAIVLHAVAGIWYSVDNIRKISHELSHIFNLPCLLLWFIDRLLCFVVYRRSNAEIVKKKIIGENEYLELRVKLNKSFEYNVGDVYYLLSEHNKLSLERAHPFTSFSNHSKDTSWDVGFIMSVMDDDLQWFPSWTRRACNIVLYSGYVK